MTEEELDAGALLILACITGKKLLQTYPRMKVPHCGVLPAEEELSNPGVDGYWCDATMQWNGRPWLMLK